MLPLQGMSSIKPCHGGGEMNRAEEVGGALVVAGDNRAELLELREKVSIRCRALDRSSSYSRVGFR